MRAWNVTRQDIVYRHNSFSAGLKAAGFEVCGGSPEGKPGNLLLIWSRYGGYNDVATRFEAAGGIVAVTENAYIGPLGVSPHSMNPREWFALGRGYHNDATVIPNGDGSRWQALGIDLKPWRTDGGHILVAANRSFGVPSRMMPSNWANEVCQRLRKLTKREIRLRPHPGNSPPKKALVDDLAGAWATVIWSSSAGVHSLIAGVPVICEAPYWIAKGAAGTLKQVENPSMPDRLPVFHRLAWGQWHLSEIESGKAFRALLFEKSTVRIVPGGPDCPHAHLMPQ